MIKILVVDDHPVFRQGLISILEKVPDLTVVNQAGNGLEAENKVEKYRPDLVIMDIRMPEGSGVESTLRIKQKFPEIKILILTVSERDADLFAAIKNGAVGYLLKGSDIDELIRGIIHAAKGETAISPVMASKLLDEFKSDSSKHPRFHYSDALTEREEEILQLVADGASNKDIATMFFITENTVKTHMRNIMSKLHAKNRYQLALFALGKDSATD